MAERITVEPGQTMENIAVQYYGSVDAVAWLLQDNAEVLPDGFSTQLEGGMNLTIRDDVADPAMLQAIELLRIVPATGGVDPGSGIIPGGPAGPDYNDDYNDDYLI